MPPKATVGPLWPHYVSVAILIITIVTAGLRVTLLGLPERVFQVSTLIPTVQVGPTPTTVIRY
jgi:hypothetical protein